MGVFVSLMASYDGIMKQQYYDLTSHILNQSMEIGRMLGVIDASHLQKPSAQLRKSNQIKSIRASLAIEGNSLSEEQVTALINQKPVMGSAREILEVKNAIATYDQLGTFDYKSKRSYLTTHNLLMKGLVDRPGQFRVAEVGVFKGSKASHVAPPAWNVDHLMNQLFNYVRRSEDNLILKSCVFHYEMEFIHPFMDGNGRMGRLWQTVILMQENPVFEFLPIEYQIKENQSGYYKALESSDKSGKCTVFIEYLLDVIAVSLGELVNQQRVNYTDIERVKYFAQVFLKKEFARKDYMAIFRNISAATATRDLKKGIELGLWSKIGDDRLTRYIIK